MLGSMSTTGTVAGISRPQEPKSRRPAWWRRPPFVIALVAFAALTVGVSAKNHLEESWNRQPLRAVERGASAANKPIGVVTPRVVDEWTSGTGPTEAAILEIVRPGNDYLEPIFYSSWRHGWPGSSDRCYFVAVQPGGTFDAEAVSSVGRVCFLDPFRTPQSISFTPVVP